MKEISTYLIAENLPESIQRQNTVDVARAIDERLQEINAWSDLVLLLPNIDSLSAELLDHLAYQFHVDFYDSSMSLQEKRSLVKNSIKWHMRKGTPAAVEEMVATVFESADTEEWFDYDGEEYPWQLKPRLRNEYRTIRREQQEPQPFTRRKRRKNGNISNTGNIGNTGNISNINS